MKSESRTAKSIKNSGVALVTYCLTLILQFYSRKIFLDYLGTEILGLNTTATNILQFLNLAELGIGSAVGFSLYKPIATDDKQSINEIISFQGIIYRRIAIIIIISAAVIMILFPLIFEKAKLPIWYAYASFGVLLWGSLLGYFVNYKQILLSAAQLEYRIAYSYKSVILVKVLFQILSMKLLPYPYLSWLALEFIFPTLASYTLAKQTKKCFPYLKERGTLKELRSKYSVIETKIKQVFFHQISGFALTQTSPLIIYAYINLEEVTLYGNYMLIILGINSLMLAVFNSVVAGVGNYLVNAETKKSLELFDELFSLRFLFAFVCVISFFHLTQIFIGLWIGSDYLLSDRIVVILTVTLFINIIRYAAGTFLSAYGIYSDIGAPIIETILNIGLSIILGYYYGLEGILMGVVISTFIIALVWKAYYLFKVGFKTSINKYIKTFIQHSILCAALWIIISYIMSYIPVNVTWKSFIIYAAILGLLSLTLGSTSFVLFGLGLKQTYIRIKKRI